MAFKSLLRVEMLWCLNGSLSKQAKYVATAMKSTQNLSANQQLHLKTQNLREKSQASSEAQ